ncbi:MAG: DUF5723 family protein [Bacteroidota bacterium]
MKSNLSVLTIVLFSVVLHKVIAGDLSNIRGVGMGRTINAASRGVDALGINPANIAIPDQGNFNLNLAPIGLRVSTELLDYGLYKEYFTGIDSVGKRWPKRLESADIDKILSQMPDLPKTRVEAEMMVGGVSFQNLIVGGIGFAFIEHAGAAITLSKDFFRMAAFGLEPAGSVYMFNGTEATAWWYGEFNVSYGRKLPVDIKFLKDLYAGIGIKIIQGYGISLPRSQKSSFGNYPDPTNPVQYTLRGNIDFLTTHAGVDFMSENSHVKASLFPPPVGKGTGFDIGLSGELINGVRIAVSVTDIGKITWDKNVIESYGSGAINITGASNNLEDTLKSVFKGKTRPGEAFDTNLPTALRLGFVTEASDIPYLKFLPGNLILALDYLQGFNESLGNTTKPRFSLGAEYRVFHVLPLRTGLAFGGGDKLRWAFGFGLDLRYFSLDFATDNFGMFFSPKSFQVVSLSLGMKVRV